MTDSGPGVRTRVHLTIALIGAVLLGAALLGASLFSAHNAAYAQDAQETPVADPTEDPAEDPVDDPEDPTDDPEDPADDPEDPADDPEDPADDPEDPADDPEDPADDPEDPADEPDTHEYTLDFQWTLLGWLGADGADIMEALENNLSDDGDLTDNVTAIFSWDSKNQEWLGFFPPHTDVPGANDFTEFTFGQAFWIAINVQDGLTWSIAQD